MEKLIERYHFKKFWNCFLRKDRCVSKWDDHRTDQDVFIRRTLGNWFVGKYFAVMFDDYVPADGIQGINWRDAYTIKYMKYVLITNIRFAYAKYHDQIVVHYLEPHSLKIEEKRLILNNWNGMWVEEDKERFTVLKKFYPIQKSKIPVPQI